MIKYLFLILFVFISILMTVSLVGCKPMSVKEKAALVKECQDNGFDWKVGDFGGIACIKPQPKECN